MTTVFVEQTWLNVHKYIGHINIAILATNIFGGILRIHNFCHIFSILIWLFLMVWIGLAQNLKPVWMKNLVSLRKHKKIKKLLIGTLILWVTYILCVSDRQVAKNREAFKMSHLISTIWSRLRCKIEKCKTFHSYLKICYLIKFYSNEFLNMMLR